MGKEHIAEKIHAKSKRADKPFVSVDCVLLYKELAASELFRHKKGVFTGAESKKQSFWEKAAGGTLFLDEIGNLLIKVKQMLLRALEAKRYRPMGAARTRKRMFASSPPTRTCRPPSPKSVFVQISIND